MTTGTSARNVYWSELLPDTGPFDAVVPIDIVGCLERCLRDGDECSELCLGDGLMAAALIRAWWSSLDDRGQRLDAYPGLTGAGYLWSALNLVSLAGEEERIAADGVWNVLRRAEANLRAWWLEKVARTEVVVLMDSDQSPVQMVAVNGTSVVRGDYRKDMRGWEWLDTKKHLW